jgi:hypothetical protein
LIAGAGTLALAGGVLVGIAPGAHAAPLDQTVVSCTGNVTVASLNPALGSGDAKYTKAALKGSDGTVHSSLTGAEDLGPAPTDATTCAVDAGISTENAATNAGTKDNPYDNQSNGHSTLTLQKESGTAGGSASCNRDTTNPISIDYPQSYPLNGKIVWKFNELDAKLHQIQIQQYVRLGSDAADPDVTHITITGIVIKGPGVGGQVDSTAAFGAAFNPKKNLGLLDCVANSTTTPAWDGSASLGQLIIQAADGPDAGTTPDPWLITIPGGAAS